MQQITSTAATPQKGGLSADILKLIAIAAMTIDHIAWAFVPTLSPAGIGMHFVGRITGITMFFFVAEGYHYTRNIKKYLLRMGIFAVVSWPAFIYFEFGTLPGPGHFYPFGVIYTLFLGLLALCAQHNIKNPLLRVAAIIACIILSYWGDWPITGVVFILLFDLLRGHYKWQALACGVLVLLNMAEFLGYWQYLVIQSGQLLPLALLAFYNGQKGRLGSWSKWIFYIYYPLHLIVLGFIKFGI